MVGGYWWLCIPTLAQTLHNPVHTAFIATAPICMFPPTPGAAILERKALDVMPSATKETSLTMVSVSLASLAGGPLANLVAHSAQGSFNAAMQMINSLERDLPIRVDGVHQGTQLLKHVVMPRVCFKLGLVRACMTHVLVLWLLTQPLHGHRGACLFGRPFA